MQAAASAGATVAGPHARLLVMSVLAVLVLLAMLAGAIRAQHWWCLPGLPVPGHVKTRAWAPRRRATSTPHVHSTRLRRRPGGGYGPHDNSKR